MRKPDDFAQRFEISDINGIFTKIVTVEQGTGALFIQGGVYKGMLPAGQYNVEKLHQRIFGLVTKLTTTVILVDSGEVSLTFSFGKTELRTKDAFEVGASGELTVKIDDDHPLNFLENYLKGKNHISLADIENNLHNELAQILRNTLSGYKISELYGNAEISRNIEEKLQNTLNARLKSKGLKIVYLNCIGFDDEAYQEVQKIKNKVNSDIELAKINYYRKIELARLDYETKIAENQLNTGLQLDADNNKTAVTINNTENRYREKTAEQSGEHVYQDREQEHQIKRDEVEQEARHEYENKEVKHQNDYMGEKLQGEIERDEAKQEHTRQNAAKNYDLYDYIQSQEIKRDLDELSGLASLQNSRQRNKIENLNSASPETRILFAKDKAQTDALTKLELAERIKGFSDDQILAFQAADSPEVAKALAAKYNADEQREFNRRTEAQFKESADRNERILEKALDVMGNTATARATAHNPGTTVVSGGIGAPVVVNPSHQNTRKCKKCGASLDEDAIFCNECGEKQD